jgi:two-component system cell cycle response regulator
MATIEGGEKRITAAIARAIADSMPEQSPKIIDINNACLPIHEISAILRANADRVIKLIGIDAYKDFEIAEISLVNTSDNPEFSSRAVENIRMLTGFVVRRTVERIFDAERLSSLSSRLNSVRERVEWLEEINHVLEREAHTDHLTNLFNKRGLAPEAKKVFEHCKEKSAPLSCLYIDLDYFKTINDTYGHDVGDLILRAFSKMIVEEFRGYDIAFKGEPYPKSPQDPIVGRDGGEEFVVLMPYTTSDEAVIAAERFRKRVQENAFKVGEGSTLELFLTCTIGVTQADFAVDKDADSLKKHADRALKNGKDDHRNVVAVRKASDNVTTYEFPSINDPNRKVVPKQGRYEHGSEL